MDNHILITGGAGYLGSLLTAELLRAGHWVTVVDDLLHGGGSMLAFIHHPNFHLIKGDVCEPGVVRMAQPADWPKPHSVVHLAAIAGFPACQTVGKQVTWRYNVEAVQRVFEQAEQLGAKRFIFSSTYHVYGLSSEGQAVREDSPLKPQSIYGESKLAAEEWLLGQTDALCAPVVFRIANLYGLSPRMRFDLLVNQFVLDAFSRRQLVIYQRNNYHSFLHVSDAVQGILAGLTAPEVKVRHQLYNLGADAGNYTKDEVVSLILKHLRDTAVRYKGIEIGGDIGDLNVSYEKIHRELSFTPKRTVEDGITELIQALSNGMFRDPYAERYRNADLIIR